jgi:hypothetical protein
MRVSAANHGVAALRLAEPFFTRPAALFKGVVYQYITVKYFSSVLII